MDSTAAPRHVLGVPPTAAPLRSRFDAELAQDPDVPRTLEVEIPLRDGVRLAADVHLPAAAQRPAPTVIFGTPYDKSSPLMALETKAYQEAGYAAIVYDCRGRGKSEGAFRAFVNDGPDGHDVVEWAAIQPWSTGAIGVSGLSYGGWITWATAAERPVHLRAIVSTSAAGRWMQEIPYTYGCFQLYFAWWTAAVERRLIDLSAFPVREAIETLPVGAIERLIQPTGETWRDMMEHDTLDEFWRSIRFDDRYHELDVPTLHVTGWHDREDLQGAFHHYEQMVADSPARDAQWLVVGPWSHPMCRWPGNVYGGERYRPDANVDMDRLHLRFFDRFLRNERNGLDEEPRVWLYDTGADGWTTPERWGSETTERTWHLGADGTLDPAVPDDGSLAYSYDPNDPPTWEFPIEGRWEPPVELTALTERDDVLVFTSPPLDEPLAIRGWSALELLATTDGDDTDWFVNVADVPPDGRTVRVAGGCLRASHRNSLSDPEPVPPGEAVRYRVEITPATHTFRRGHRLRVTITSAEFPWFARSMNCFGPIRDQAEPRVARNVVHSGRDATRLLLPTVD